MGDSSAMVFPLSPFYGSVHGLRLVTAVANKTRSVQHSRVLSFVFAQWQPPQVEQLPVQDAEGSCTVMGSPPFMAVLMMASI